MTNKDIIEIAMSQSAIDINCDMEDFLKNENIIVESKLGEGARVYYNPPIPCNLVSYGSNVVASVEDKYRDIVEDYLKKYDFYRCFETPNMHVLDEQFAKYNQKVCFMAEYFLPDLDRLTELECSYEIKILEKDQLQDLYTGQWDNALCEGRKERDVLAAGAYDNGVLVGLAGCSADCDKMWQIGVDVTPEYRCKGIASALTSRLALEILKRGKVPFYCCAWSNIKSVRNAIKSGFYPAWVEMTVKSKELVDEMNSCTKM